MLEFTFWTLQGVTEEFRKEAGVRCEAADPRYIGGADDRDRRDIVLRGRDVRDVLQWDVNLIVQGAYDED